MTAKRKAKGHAILRASNAAKSNEPIINEENYNVSISSALTWYSEHTTEKQRLKYVLEYFAKQGKKAEVLALSKATAFEIRVPAIIARLITREQPLTDVHKQKLIDDVAKIVEKYPVVKEKKEAEVKPTNVISIQERMEEKAKTIAADIDGAIDDWTLCKGKGFEFSTKNYLLSKEVAAPIAKRVGEFYVGLSAELHEAIGGECDQLNEGYSHYTKRELKKFAEFVDGIIADCQQMVQTAKATRAPRKRKAVPLSKQVAKVKYMKEFTELNLKSIKPEDILTSSELWVYNTKYRKVQVYKADMGTLGIKGTTVIGFSIKDSTSLTLRKPEEFFKGLSMGKRALNGAIKSIKTKPAAPNGRINEECILLGAF